jgi:hypothetical protein
VPTCCGTRGDAAGCVALGLVVARRGSAQMMQHAPTETLYETVLAAERLAGGAEGDAAPSIAEAALDQLHAGPAGFGSGGGEEDALYADIGGGPPSAFAAAAAQDAGSKRAAADDSTNSKRIKTEGALAPPPPPLETSLPLRAPCDEPTPNT